MIQRIHCRWQFCSRRPIRRQSGAVLVAALVCLLIVVTILGSMLQGTLRARRQLHAERDMRQTGLLLQAGADRAALRLSNETDYRGETWILPAEAVVGSHDGQVTIEASRDSDEEPWQVRIVAEYRLGSQLSIRRTRTFLVLSSLPLGQE